MEHTEQMTQTALWMPGWYELDQPIIVGETSRFWFFQNPPSDYPDVESFDFVFFNQLSSASNCQVREARIVGISHPQLGEIQRIDTDGLDYIFCKADGSELIVNAEEDPGTVYDVPVEVENWAINVCLTDVSDPLQLDS